MCTIEGCEGRFYARGWCNKHYKRWLNHGDPMIDNIGRGKPRVKVPKYVGAHVRVHRARGRAALYNCVACDGQAAEWAYNHKDPNEVTGEHHDGMAVYSIDPNFYQPMCAPCHKDYDRS